MSIDDRIDELRRRTEKAIKAMPKIIDAYSSKLSDIKRRMEMEVDRGKLRGELDELRLLNRNVRGEVLRNKRQLMRDLHKARVEIRSEIHKMPEGQLKDALEGMEVKLDKLEDHVKEELDDVRDKLEILKDRVDDVEGKMEDKIGEWKRKVEVISR